MGSGNSESTAVELHSELSALSATEQARRDEIENRIWKNADEIAIDLLTLHDERLYRSTHATWDEYCQNILHLSKRRVNQKILAAGIIVEITSRLQEDVHSGNHGSHLIDPPTNERQARPLAALPSAERTPAWKEATATAPKDKKTGKPKPTAKHVEKVVAKRIAEKAAPAPKPEPAKEPAPLPPLEQMPWVRPYNELLADVIESIDSLGAHIEKLIALDGTNKAFTEWMNVKEWRRTVKEIRLRFEQQRVTRWANQKEKDRLGRPFVYDKEERKKVVA